MKKETNLILTINSAGDWIIVEPTREEEISYQPDYNNGTTGSELFYKTREFKLEKRLLK